LFGIFAQGYNNASGFSSNSAAVRMLANENFTTTGVGSSIVFETASDGTTGRLERMRVTGSGTVSVGTTSVLGQLGVVSATAARQGLIVRGAASQSANLQEWQESNAGVPSAVTAFGGFRIRTFGATYSDTSLAVQAGYTTEVPVRVRGVASQTANLTEWQNSAGTILTRIESTGNLVVPGTTGAISSGTFIVGSRNSGAEITMVRQTAATSNPGANLARMYFRDGTDAGTLKLVVRAGASGAETTILDNIPQ
jgi:hypothetical protein